MSTLTLMTLSITTIYITDTDADCCIFITVFTLRVIIQTVVMLIVIMQTVVTLIVIMQTVVTLIVIMQTVVTLVVIMQTVVMLSVIMLSVGMLNLNSHHDDTQQSNTIATLRITDLIATFIKKTRLH